MNRRTRAREAAEGLLLAARILLILRFGIGFGRRPRRTS